MKNKWFIDHQLQQQLNEIKDMMKKTVKSGDSYLDGSLDYLMASGGKMIRPMLLLIGARLGREYNNMEKGLIALSTAIETIHLATLVHDDIIDQSTMRRGQLSIQAKYGQAYAVYMGDYLLSKSLLMLAHLEMEKELAISLTKVVSSICIGDIRQYQNRYKVNLTPRQYIKSVTGKTSALISIALSSGAYYCKAKEEDIRLLGRIGHSIGMVFQLVDDLLDYCGDSDVVGKDLQADIMKGYYNMPIIYSLQQDNAESRQLKEILGKELTKESLKEVYELIHACGGINKTKDLVLKYKEKAMMWIRRLPDGETKIMLETFVPTLVDRVK